MGLMVSIRIKKEKWDSDVSKNHNKIHAQSTLSRRYM